MRVELRPVTVLGDEITPSLRVLGASSVFTTREPELFNHLLRYPRGGLTAWHLRCDETPRGFAVLALASQPGGVTVGRVVECLTDRDDDDLRHGAAVALTRELARQGADVAQAFASTGRMARAWRDAGYAPVHALEFRLRDRARRLPAGAGFHLTPLEADYAYT